MRLAASTGVWQRESTAVQLAEFLRGELVGGRWRGRMPGVIRLARELGVARNSVEQALRTLEREGVLRGCGAGRGRRIEVRAAGCGSRGLRVAILLGEPADGRLSYLVELLHELAEAGHGACFAERSLAELGGEVQRVARQVKATAADAWVVCAGSGEVLEWFVGRGIPVFALFGRRRGVPVAGAGPDKPPVIAVATRRLLELGHRRIVLLTRRVRRLPEPGASERAFLGELVANGIEVGPYHLPNWEETIGGFHARLDALFEVTPPSALIVDEAPLYLAAERHLARRGIVAPEGVSLICTDGSPAFDWCEPSVAHIRWDSRPVVRRIVRWAANVSRGRRDVRQTLTKAEFVEGGTIGPAKRE